MNGLRIVSVLALFLCCLLQPGWTQSGSDCALSYRPKTNELAFAAVGAVLKVADRTCTEDYLIIPFDQQAAAVKLPEGEYPPRGRTFTGGLLFGLYNNNGNKVESCVFCDPLSYLETHGDEHEYLCVISKLNIRSCAKPDQISFSVIKKNAVEENVCTPSLIYAGRENNHLKFEVMDCQKNNYHPLLTYDLKLGNVMRYLDERFEVLSADNEGIYFRRLSSASHRPYELPQTPSR